MEGNMNYTIEAVGETKRVININDKRIELNRIDPHGYWYFKWDAGDPPVKLQGAFTNVGQATEFLVNYFASLKTRKAA